MSGGVALGSGFARGLANVLLSKRNEDRQQQFRDDDRQQMLKVALFNKALEEGVSPDDAMAATGLDLHFGEKPAKGAPNHNEVLTGLLGSISPTQDFVGPVQPEAAGPTQFVRDAIAGTAHQVAPKTAPKRTLFGLELPSDEEKLQKQVDTQKAIVTGQMDATTEAKLNQAARLRAQDPTLTVAQSLIDVGLRTKPEKNFAAVGAGGTVYDENTGKPSFTAPDKEVKLPGALGERTRQLLAANPGMSEATASASAAKALADEREIDRKNKESAVEDIATNRAFRSTLLKLQTSNGGLTPSAALSEADRLREGWQKKILPIIERTEQVGKIDTALQALKDGNRLPAVDQILVAFQKLNDERTGVREGEVQRIINGLGLPARIEGAITKLRQNGASIPDDELRGLAQLAKDTAATMTRVRGAELSSYRKAIEESIKPYPVIKPETIFGDSTIGVITPPPGKSKFSVTLDGDVYPLDSQEQVDAFKQRYPRAK